MSDAGSQQLLERVGQRVLEDAAFLFVEVSAAPPPVAPRLEAALEFRGPRLGELRLAAAPEVAVIIAANMLGIEPDDPEASASAEQALGELLNVLGGALVVELFGTGEVCNLGIPSVQRREGPAPAPSTARACFLLDDAPSLELSVELREI